MTFNLNLKQPDYTNYFYGAQILNISAINQYLIMTINVLDLIPFINITVSNVTESNRITLTYIQADYVNIKNPE